MWTAVVAVCPIKSVPMDRDAIVDQTVIAVSVTQVLVKVSAVTGNGKILSFSLVVPTCNDTFMNANETGIDCGGWCASQKKCADLMGCRDTNDCISGVCTANLCQSNDKNLKCEEFELVYRSSYL